MPIGSKPINIQFDYSYFGAAVDETGRTCSTAASQGVLIGQSPNGACPTAGAWSNCTWTCTSGDVASSEYLNLLRTDHIPKAKTLLQRYIIVRPEAQRNTSLFLDELSTCGSSDYYITIPQSYYSTNTENATGIAADVDVLVFLTARPMQSEFLAFGVDCMRSSDSFSRTLVAYLNIAPTSSLSTQASIRPYMIARELLKILGFSSRFFGSSVSEVSRQNNGESRLVPMLSIPRVVDVAQKYYNCSTINAVPLENYGLESAAPLTEKGWTNARANLWEERVFRSELMTGNWWKSRPSEARISVLTLAVIESYGWAWVNYTAAQTDYTFGRAFGCKFLDGGCSSWAVASTSRDGYFCSSSADDSTACSYDLQARAACETTAWSQQIPKYYRIDPSVPTSGGPNGYADYCPLPMPTTVGDCRYPDNKPADGDDWGETYSFESRCFRSSVKPFGNSRVLATSARCYQFACANGTSMYVKVGVAWVLCPAGGGTISSIPGWEGSIICPSIDVVCPYGLTTSNFGSDITNPQKSGNSLYDFVEWLRSIPFYVWIAIGCVAAIILIIIIGIAVIIAIRVKKARQWKTKKIVDLRRNNKEIDIEH